MLLAQATNKNSLRKLGGCFFLKYDFGSDYQEKFQTDTSEV